MVGIATASATAIAIRPIVVAGGTTMAAGGITTSGDRIIGSPFDNVEPGPRRTCFAARVKRAAFVSRFIFAENLT